MAQESIITEIDETGVATITLNRPAVHNAFDDALIESLTACLHDLGQQPEVRVVVLAALGDSFSAGADINWMRRMAGYSEKENLNDARRLAKLMKTLNDLPRPTIARVHGAAFGGGVGLVACCDIALASEKAAFCLSEVKLGLIPSVIGPYVVRAIGTRQARRYFVTAERFDAREAQRIGLVHKVVAPESLDEWVGRFAKLLHANGPRAMAAAKQMVDAVAGRPLDEAMVEDTARRIAEIRVSDEGQEGLDAFLGKRRPDWAES